MVKSRIAVVINKYSIGKSSPVICLLDLLSDHFEVDLFLKSVRNTNVTVLSKKSINVIAIESDEDKNVLRRLWDSLYGRNRDKEITEKRNYSHHLCCDPFGFFLCKKLFPDSKPFYYSLELCFRDNHFNMDYPAAVMNMEKEEINNIKGLIIQSKERELLFRKEHLLSDNLPSFLLPVTYQYPSVKDKSFLLRSKYGIGDRQKIAIHLGGIQEYFSCIEIALSFATLDNWVLVFHGYHFGKYIDRLRAAISANNITNVIISEEVYDHIEEMDSLLMSCDMGIAWYNDVSPNFTTAGKSSGKISAYLRFGLPVIAKKYPSTMEAIEDAGCGVCVDDFDAIPDAVRKIEANFQSYSDNCRNEYDKVYWFENYRAGLLDFIRG